MSSQNNRLFCQHCVCYVCQKPPGECLDWFKFTYGLPNNLREHHCNATITPGTNKIFWEAAAAAAAHVARNQEPLRPRAVGPGPFEPSHETACQDKDLTQCRKCQWYNRFPPITRTTATTTADARRPTVFANHWCHACGRVASEGDLGKEQSKPYSTTAALNDILLGTKTIHFSLHTHDPRQMNKFQKRWADNEFKPEWTFNEKEMEEELFRHRFGKRPTLRTILASIPVLPRDQIPKDGGLGSGAPHRMASVSETQATLLDDPRDVLVLQEISRNSRKFGGGARGDYETLAGDIVARWDSEQRKGVSLLSIPLVVVVAVADVDACFTHDSIYLTILSSRSHFVARPLSSECSWRAGILNVLRT
jgi:hypothetical protein